MEGFFFGPWASCSETWGNRLTFFVMVSRTVPWDKTILGFNGFILWSEQDLAISECVLLFLFIKMENNILE